MTSLAVGVPFEAVRARYAVGVLLDLIHVDWHFAQPGEAVDLVYGDGPGRCRIPAGPDTGWDDPRPDVTKSDGLSIIARPGAPRGPLRERDGLGVDILYSTYAVLTAPWEREDPVDEVGCPIATRSWLAQNGLLLEPIVDRYAHLLANALQRPSGRAATIVITHDVDNNFRHLFGVRERLELLRRSQRGFSRLTRIPGLARELASRRADPNDRFDEWSAWHREWASRPTYFVASYGLFQPGSDRRDVPYDIRHPRVAETLRELVDGGAEVGVHLSIRARESTEQIRIEREMLEQVIGAPVRSARHHWWAVGQPVERTIRRQRAAGLALDCSLGFNDGVGFRRGVAGPFRPFDPEEGGRSRMWALPTTAMDAALFDGIRPFEEAVDQLHALWRIVREVGGTLVLDWHAHAANPAVLSRAGAGLRAFMSRAVENGASCATPSEVTARVVEAR